MHVHVPPSMLYIHILASEREAYIYIHVHVCGGTCMDLESPVYSLRRQSFTCLLPRAFYSNKNNMTLSEFRFSSPSLPGLVSQAVAMATLCVSTRPGSTCTEGGMMRMGHFLLSTVTTRVRVWESVMHV